MKNNLQCNSKATLSSLLSSSSSFKSTHFSDLEIKPAANPSKMLTENQDFSTPKFLQMKQDDKSLPRLLSKEKKNSLYNSSSAAATVAGELDSSFRMSYYGDAGGSVPFLWESQPGTPKHRFSDTPDLPPLTPPPSYKFSPNDTTMQKKNPKNSKIFIISKMTSSKKINMSPSFSSSSSSGSSSSYSAPSTPLNGGKYSMAKSTSALHSGLYEEGQEPISPTSTLYFGNPNGRSSSSSSRIKRAFLSIAGHAK